MSNLNEEDLESAGTSWYQFDLAKPSGMQRAVKKLEFIFRKSMTYDSWARRSKFQIRECPLCDISFDIAKPETHHHPETLFDITERVLQHHIDLNDVDKMTDFQIIEEIADEHFTKKIRYIVLCNHCHDKYHNEYPDVLNIINEAQIKQERAQKEKGI